GYGRPDCHGTTAFRHSEACISPVADQSDITSWSRLKSCASAASSKSRNISGSSDAGIASKVCRMPITGSGTTISKGEVSGVGRFLRDGRTRNIATVTTPDAPVSKYDTVNESMDLWFQQTFQRLINPLRSQGSSIQRNGMAALFPGFGRHRHRGRLGEPLRDFLDSLINGKPIHPYHRPVGDQWRPSELLHGRH